MYVFFSHESKYDLQLSDLHENCAHRVFLTDSEVFCLSHENILGHKTHGMTCTVCFQGWLDLYLGPFLARNGHLCYASVGALTRSCYGYMPPRQRPHLGQHSKNVPLSLTSPYALKKLLLFSDRGT